MYSKIKKIIVACIIAFIVIKNFNYFFNLFEHLAVILFIPLIIAVIKLAEHSK